MQGLESAISSSPQNGRLWNENELRTLVSSIFTNFSDVLRVQSGNMQSGNFVTGVSGWNLDSNGNFEGNNGTFRGAIAVGTDPNSFHTDSSGNSWWGASTFASAPASISNTGRATFNTVLDTGISFKGGGNDGLTSSTSGVGYTLSRTLLNTSFVSSGAGTGSAVLYSTYFGSLPSGIYLSWNSGTQFNITCNVQMSGTLGSVNTSAYFGAFNQLSGSFSGTTNILKHYSFIINNNKLYASCANGTTQTLSSEITGITLTDKHTYNIVYNVGTNILFYVDGVQKTTLSTNMPTVPGSASDAPALFFGIVNPSSSVAYSMLLGNNYSIIWNP